MLVLVNVSVISQFNGQINLILVIPVRLSPDTIIHAENNKVNKFKLHRENSIDILSIISSTHMMHITVKITPWF